MPDQTTVYTLNPPSGPDLLFNNGSFGRGSADDIYYLTDVQGIDTAELRTPRFKQPVDHGSRLLPFFEEGLTPRFEGMIVVQSVRTGNAIRARRMVMYEALRTALRACLASPGVISWTESGVGARSLSVQYYVRLAHTWSDQYQSMLFTFGLASEDSTPT